MTSTEQNSPVLNLRCYAKVNLDLEVLGKRDDGFHEIRSRMVMVSLFDKLAFFPAANGDGISLKVAGADLPTGPDNLVVKAANAFSDRTGKDIDFSIELTKRVPSGAGLGGGSSDAAQTLHGLNHLTKAGLTNDELAEIAAGVGSDVPFFLFNQPCEVSGRGEIVERINFEWELPIVLLKPKFGVETPSAYRGWADSKETPGVLYAPQICPWGAMVNSLERPVFEKFPALADMKMWLLAQPETHAALMSGSGSTMLVVLAQQHGGEGLVQRAREEFGETLWGFVGHTLVDASEPEPTGIRHPA